MTIRNSAGVHLMTREYLSNIMDDHWFEVCKGKYGYRVVIVYYVEILCFASAIGRTKDWLLLAEAARQHQIDLHAFGKE